MELTKELWGKTPCGKEIFLYTLKNESGAYVQLSSVGAGVVSVVVPDKDGVLADVCLGYPDPISLTVHVPERCPDVLQTV